MMAVEDPFEEYGEIRQCLTCSEDFNTEDVLCTDYCELHQPRSIDYPKVFRIPATTVEDLKDANHTMDKITETFGNLKDASLENATNWLLGLLENRG